jgi:hypothetical protein
VLITLIERDCDDSSPLCDFVSHFLFRFVPPQCHLLWSVRLRDSPRFAILSYWTVPRYVYYDLYSIKLF